MDCLCHKRKMRFYNYVMIIIGMVVILNLTGIQTPVTGGIMEWMGLIDGSDIAMQNIKDSTGWGRFEYLLVSAVAAGVVLGAFGRTPDIRYITAAIVFAITSALVADLTSIIILVNSQETFGGVFGKIFSIIGVAAIVGLFITAISYWQSPD